MEIFDICASNMTNFHCQNVIFSHILGIKWRKISLKTACVWAAQISSYRLPKVQKDAVRYRAASAQNIRPCRDARKENLKTSHKDFVSVVLVLLMHLIPNNPTFTSKILAWRRKNKKKILFGWNFNWHFILLAIIWNIYRVSQKKRFLGR